ncbi:MAG: 23S rRNA (uracil(1939)-C(5))-methyltransferase RlmD [Clostridia bacterium]|nr:23S rRNA (uracil(1939)-C(5))-methyltransferase RlmD [Clostridia bacterium]
MVKNEKILLEITDVTQEGFGVGRYDNTVVFVPFTAVGDIVSALIIKVNKNYCVGKLLEIKTKSENRIIPDCENFTKCGGCCYRHINYETELKLKAKRVEDCIKRIAKIDLEAKPAVSNGKIERYRNKAQFPIGQNGALGFYANRSHRIIETEDCLLQPELFGEAVNVLKSWIATENISVYNSETGRGLLRHFYLRASKNCENIMAVLVINGDDIPKKDVLITALNNRLGNRLKSVALNINKKNNNVILGYENKTVYGSDYIEDEICNVKVRLSPNSFYQVNREMAELLYNKAKEYANPNGKIILDLYCGTGTIGLTMAKEAASVIGVEIVEEAIKDAKLNAENNGITNVRFICADALKAVEELKKDSIKPDVVILDPPRKGSEDKVIETVAKSFCPERVVYVSCDPSTLARDIKLFGEYGYKLIEYTPYDLFPKTSHIESVALLLRTD